MIPAFAITTYKDVELAETVISEIRQYFPESPIIQLSDIPHRLKVPKFGGAWTKRYLSSFMAKCSSPLLIKIDPDCGVYKNLTSFPSTELFGQYDKNKVLYGGILGFSREAVKKILDSKLLDDSEYLKPKNEYKYHRFIPPNLKAGEVRDPIVVSRQDIILGDVVSRLALTTAEWNDVFVTPVHTRPAAGDYAMTHPRKG